MRSAYVYGLVLCRHGEMAIISLKGSEHSGGYRVRHGYHSKMQHLQEIGM